MELTTTYPEWQKVIREAQALAESKNQARIDTEIDRKRKAVEDALENLRGRLQQVGISGLGVIANGDTPEIHAGDGYTFFLNRSNTILVQRRVPDASEELQAEVEGSYCCEVAEMIVSGNPEAFAYAIDSVDRRAEEQAKHNQYIVEQYHARQAFLKTKLDAPKLCPIAMEEFTTFREMKPWVLEQVEKGYVLKSHTVHIDDGIPAHTVIMELAEAQP